MMPPQSWQFGSFFLGGFECSSHRTLEGHRLDLIAVTQHDTLAAEDYALCRALGLRAVREAAVWPVLDRAGVLDLAPVRRLARLGRAAGLLQIWDLMHYGYPDDLDPFGPEFPRRFAAYARAVATVVRDETPGPHYYTPINEISYNAWAAGEVGYMAPFGQGRGGALKRALVGAAVAGIEAIWAVDPEAQMFNVDPLVRQHAPAGRPDLQPQADHFNRHVVTEAFDMLAGRVAPELGGSRAHLGIIGLNYYAGNQWTIPTPEQPQRFLHWADPAWLPLSTMLADLEARYGGPIVIAETGAAGMGRPGWLAHLAGQAQAALAAGVNLQGICWYPVVTSPDWEDPTAFFDGGLFDVAPAPDGRLDRVLSPPVTAALRTAQAALDPANLPADPGPVPAPAAGPPAAPPIRLEEAAHFKADNFSYRTLLAGEQLVVELYSLQPGASVPPHRHPQTEHVLTGVAGTVEVWIGETFVLLGPGETLLVPAGPYHAIHNPTATPAIVQQVSAPKPWDARFQGPHPGSAPEPRPMPPR